MFDFFLDAHNYESRKVAHHEDGKLCVDTVRVSDGVEPYETGITHPEYNGGEWVIVEAYDTKEAAQVGHDKWVSIMSADNLPDSLEDCCNAHITGWLSSKPVFKREPAE